MQQVKESLLFGTLGAAGGFIATKGLALCGVTVTNPAMGALYGAAIFMIPSFQDIGVHIKADKDSLLGQIAKIALYTLVYTAIGMAATALCGFQFTIGNALILTCATVGITGITDVALTKMYKAVRGASTAQA